MVCGHRLLTKIMSIPSLGPASTFWKRVSRFRKTSGPLFYLKTASDLVNALCTPEPVIVSDMIQNCGGQQHLFWNHKVPSALSNKPLFSNDMRKKYPHSCHPLAAASQTCEIVQLVTRLIITWSPLCPETQCDPSSTLEFWTDVCLLLPYVSQSLIWRAC